MNNENICYQMVYLRLWSISYQQLNIYELYQNNFQITHRTLEWFFPSMNNKNIFFWMVFSICTIINFTSHHIIVMNFDFSCGVFPSWTDEILLIKWYFQYFHHDQFQFTLFLNSCFIYLLSQNRKKHCWKYCKDALWTYYLLSYVFILILYCQIKKIMTQHQSAAENGQSITQLYQKTSRLFLSAVKFFRISFQFHWD